MSRQRMTQTVKRQWRNVGSSARSRRPYCMPDRFHTHGPRCGCGKGFPFPDNTVSIHSSPHTSTEQLMARGAFIVIEGLDRSGKTTQTELLAEHLATTGGGGGLSVSRCKFPGERAQPHHTTHHRPLLPSPGATHTRRK